MMNMFNAMNAVRSRLCQASSDILSARFYCQCPFIKITPPVRQEEKDSATEITLCCQGERHQVCARLIEGCLVYSEWL
ncbi:MAG: hypothetical protein ACTXOO_00755 [Sodalis sp. (in: enterobacteria)]